MSTDVRVLTCVHDARRTAGGVAGVSLQVHQEFLRRGVDAFFLAGISPETPVPYQFEVSKTGSGIDRFSLSKQRREVVHVHGLWTPFVWRACRYAKCHDLPLVISPHGMLEPWALAHKYWKKKAAWVLYQKKVLNSADMLVVNSGRELDSVRAMGFKGAVAVIGNGVDIADYHLPCPGLSSNKVALFLSRLSPVKGLPDLISAWSMLPVGHGYQLHLYGHADAGYDAVLYDLIKMHNLDNEVKLLGPVFGAEKWNAYFGASFFVLPSYSENFGIVVAEALWAGLPVITTTSTPWECLARERIGWQVDNDPVQIKDAILMAMKLEGNECSDMRLRALTYAKSNFSWPDIAEKYLCSYKWLLEGNNLKPSWINCI